MSQTSVDFSDNPTGSQLMDNYLAKEQENNLTTNSGVKRPSYAVAGTKWLDTSSQPWTLKMYTGSGDVVIGYIDKNKGTFQTPMDTDAVHITGDETIDDIKTFKQGIKGTFENYYAYNAATNDKPWKKLMEITLSGTYNTINIPFMMNNPVTAKFGWGSGTINLRNENVAGTLNSATSGIHFNILPNWWVHYDYKLLYKNNYPETGKILIEFWVKISSTYAGVCFTILDMLNGGTGKLDRTKITWYNNTQQYAELPTGYNEISYTLDIMQTNTPQTGSNSKEIATTEWYNNKHKVVSALPSSPTTGVTYLIPQTEELTTTSYIPDYASYVDIADKTYTAPSDGWIFWRATGTGGQVTVNGVVVGLAGNYTDQPFAQFLVGKGDIITCSGKNMFRFIPFKK